MWKEYSHVFFYNFKVTSVGNYLLVKEQGVMTVKKKRVKYSDQQYLHLVFLLPSS